MNKLQKEIIEIIEPYMDKTLSKGVFVYLKRKQTNVEDYFNEDTQEIDWMDLPDTIEEKLCDLLSNVEIKEYISRTKQKDTLEHKIIWHYDITAVLKYIKNKETCPYNLEYTFDLRDKWFISINKLERWFNSIYKEKEFSKIPLKPLHLYTEEENKDLLQLLKKLWTN